MLSHSVFLKQAMQFGASTMLLDDQESGKMQDSKPNLVQERIPLEELKLDPENPRLPEEFLGASQASLMKLFFKDYDLDELASSFVENGFFEAEALIVQNGIVKEGNRRLAALKYLLHDADADDADLPLFDLDEPLNNAAKARLSNVPVFSIPSDMDLSSYLGFHHINGPLQWSASSKARYISNRVDKVASEGDENPFYTISKEIGSNVQGVRNAYRQYALLKVARDMLDLRKESTFILDKRFGVWARLTSSSTIYDYIGFHPAGTGYLDIKSALENDESFDRQNFKLLLCDLNPVGDRAALLNDSRRASVYTQALEDPAIIKVLRETRDYSLVQDMVNGKTINDRLDKVADHLSRINDDIMNGGHVDGSTVEVLKRIERIIIGMKSVASANMEDVAGVEAGSS